MRDQTRALHRIGERLLQLVIKEGQRERQLQLQSPQLPVVIHERNSSHPG